MNNTLHYGFSLSDKLLRDLWNTSILLEQVKYFKLWFIKVIYKYKNTCSKLLWEKFQNQKQRKGQKKEAHCQS